jgi:hypothetical protein
MALLMSIAAEFRGLIATSIPHIIDGLLGDELYVRNESVGMLSEFSAHGMSSICSHMVLLTGIAAEFRRLIATSIPQIINLLQDDNKLVRWPAVAALSEFSVHGMSSICSGMALLMSIAAEFRGLIVTSIPHIIDLLQEDELNVRNASVHALLELSEHGM